jgi:hypothetical protein
LRGFGRVWVAFEAVFHSGVRFLCSLVCFLLSPGPSPSLSLPRLLRHLREERENCASARLTLNSLLVRGTGCHRKDLLLGTNADGGVPGAAIRRAGPGEKLDARCLRRRELGPLCLRRIILDWRGYTDG